MSTLSCHLECYSALIAVCIVYSLQLEVASLLQVSEYKFYTMSFKHLDHSGIALLFAGLCLCVHGQLPARPYSIQVVSLSVESMTGFVEVELTLSASENVTVNSTIEVVTIDRNGEANIVRNISAIELQMILTESNGSLRLEGLRQNENFTIELQEGTENTTLSNSAIFLTTGVQYITAEAGIENATVTCHFLVGTTADGCLVRWRLLNNLTDNVQFSSILVSRRNDSSSAQGVVRTLSENTSYVVEAFSTRHGTVLHGFSIPLQEVLTTESDGRQAAFNTEPSSTTATVSTSVGLAIGLSIFFAILAAFIVVIITVLVTCMYLRQNSKLNGNRMWRLRAGRRKQSTMTKNDTIVIQANMCYDSTVLSVYHDEDFHEYDDVVYHTSASAHDSVIADHQNEDYYDTINRGTSVASSVHLTDCEVPCEYEIPVHSNSAYETRDTLNDYEN